MASAFETTTPTAAPTSVEQALGGTANKAATAATPAPAPATMPTPDVSRVLSESNGGGLSGIYERVLAQMSPSAATIPQATTPQPMVDNGAIIKQQTKNALDTAMATLRARTRQGGMPSAVVKNTMQGAVRSVLAPQSTAPQPTAPTTTQLTAPAAAQPTTEVKPTKENEPAPIGGVAAQEYGVTMGRALGGGNKIPTFNYGDVAVEMPRGIDLNNDEEVRTAYAESKASMERMDELYSREEEV